MGKIQASHEPIKLANVNHTSHNHNFFLSQLKINGFFLPYLANDNNRMHDIIFLSHE